MERFRSLAPFAAGGLAVVLVTSAVLAFTLKDLTVGRPRPPTVEPTRPAAVRPPELSRSGHLAYWRTEPDGVAKLAVQNLDGSLRRFIDQVDNPRRISRTRWNADGDALSYVDAGAGLVVVRLDGTRVALPLPGTVLADGRRIVDQRWSPSGAKIAATLQRSTDGRSDVWVTSSGAAAWTRATQMEDAFAADWLDDDELLVQTTSGLLGVLRAAGLNAIRPITGLGGGSPWVGEDGRIYFLGGRTVGSAADAGPTVSVTGGLWSALVDGGDARKELDLPQEALRLDARLPGGALLVHRGSAPAQAIALGSRIVDLPATAGVIERIELGSDVRSAIGFTATRIMRVDLTRPDRAAITVLLDGVGDADAWFPVSARAARPQTTLAQSVPKALYAFALAGSIWTMGADGVPSLLRATTDGPIAPRRPNLAVPSWSPAGDRLLTTDFGPAPIRVPGAVVLDRSGAATRIATLTPIARSAVWSPDGRTVAAVVAPGGAPASSGDDLQVRFARIDGGSAPEAIAGREVAWSTGGLFVIGNGTPQGEARSRPDLPIERIDGASRRVLASLPSLMADPRAQAPAGAQNPAIAELAASPDGTHLSVRLTYQPPAGQTGSARAFIVTIRANDGRPSAFLGGDTVMDAAWAPARPLLGFTTQGPLVNGQRTSTASVADARTAEMLARVDGRFAGWSPDGEWFYVARDTGLYARRLDSPDAVRVSAVGAQVATTAP